LLKPESILLSGELVIGLFLSGTYPQHGLHIFSFLDDAPATTQLRARFRHDERHSTHFGSPATARANSFFVREMQFETDDEATRGELRRNYTTVARPVK